MFLKTRTELSCLAWLHSEDAALWWELGCSDVRGRRQTRNIPKCHKELE